MMVVGWSQGTLPTQSKKAKAESWGLTPASSSHFQAANATFTFHAHCLRGYLRLYCSWTRVSIMKEKDKGPGHREWVDQPMRSELRSPGGEGALLGSSPTEKPAQSAAGWGWRTPGGKSLKNEGVQAQLHTVIQCLETLWGKLTMGRTWEYDIGIYYKKEGRKEGRGNPKLQEEKRTRMASSTHVIDQTKALFWATGSIWKKKC